MFPIEAENIPLTSHMFVTAVSVCRCYVRIKAVTNISRLNKYLDFILIFDVVTQSSSHK